MAKQRSNKPTPKSQRQISNDLVEPYITSQGNPNESSPKINQPNFNRGNKISWRGEDAKQLIIGLQDIDESIMYYFNEVIKPSVIQNGQHTPVPIIYGSPEKWKSFQKDGYYRDKNGAIMQPLIMFRRENIKKNKGIGNKLDANNPNNYGVFQKAYTSQNSYNQFDVLTNRIPDKEYIAVVYPDYVTIRYKCSVSTYYVEQMNKIIEAINYAAGSYWGNPERFKFRASIQDFANITEITRDNERVVKTNFTIQLDGYIIPDIVQKSLNSITKFNDKSKIIFSMEVMEDSEFFSGYVKGKRIVSTTDQGSKTNAVRYMDQAPMAPYQIPQAVDTSYRFLYREETGSLYTPTTSDNGYTINMTNTGSLGVILPNISGSSMDFTVRIPSGSISASFSTDYSSLFPETSNPISGSYVMLESFPTYNTVHAFTADGVGWYLTGKLEDITI